MHPLNCRKQHTQCQFTSPSGVMQMSGGLDIQFVLLVECRHCRHVFSVCRFCWRGQAYCSESCRISRSRSLHSQAQRRYRSTDRGRESHRQAEQRRRQRQKTVDDDTSTPAPAHDSVVVVEVGHCHFCGVMGRVVESFPRRGYGGRPNRVSSGHDGRW